MKKKPFIMRQLQILTIILVFVGISANGQTLRYRFTANSGFVINETGQGEIANTNLDFSEYPSATDFSPSLKIGADFEVMAPITDRFEVGVEFEYGNLSGRTETPLLYNFWFFDSYNPMPDDYIYPEEAIFYETTQLSVLGTSRFYLLPLSSDLSFFIKAFGGISFVGTDLKFHDPYYRVKYNVGVLYARGSLNSQEPKDRAFYGGAGIGGHLKLSKGMAIYLETNLSFINSDLVNGVPDFNFITGSAIEYEAAEGIGTLAGQISLGLVYSATPDQRFNRGSYTKSKRYGKIKTWKKKRKNPFKRKR